MVQRPSTAPAGESPFHAKGLVYQGALKFYDDFLPGGLATLRPRLAPELARFFLDQPFLAGSWYDVLPILPISREAAHLKGIPHAQLVRANAAWVAERDMNGVYRFALKLTSPMAVASRLPRLSMQYFDFGSVEEAVTSSCELQTTRRGIPEPCAEWMLWVTQGFTPVVLKAAGARNVTVHGGVPEPDGRVLGIPTVQLDIRITWS